MIKTPLQDNVTTSITGTLTAIPIENESATGSSTRSAEPIPNPVSFATDSWATIQKAVQDNNTSAYNIGDTKTVTINNTDYTVRIANKSKAASCSNSNYSETACGFVVEFTDIITTMAIRSDNKTIEGGYPATDVYTYINNILYSQLPIDLQKVIKTTRVVSGYGCKEYNLDFYECINPDNNGSNFITNDKLYLLSSTEVTGYDDADSSRNMTTIFDYYSLFSSAENVQKKYQGSNYDWLLRNPVNNVWAIEDSTRFRVIDSSGYISINMIQLLGVSPAFRIG